MDYTSLTDSLVSKYRIAQDFKQLYIFFIIHFVAIKQSCDYCILNDHPPTFCEQDLTKSLQS